MTTVAMWLQETDSISSGNSRLLMIFIGLVAVAMIAQAVAQIVFAIKGAKALKSLMETVETLKAKALPVLDSATEISAAAQLVVRENMPKVRVITENLVDASHVLKGSAMQWGATFSDANLRTARQVARVDGIITAVLQTTAELVETVNNGIRGPAHKIAVMTTQAKIVIEGMLEKVKGFTPPSKRPKY